MESGALTPPLAAHLARLGTQVGFAAAAQELGLLRQVTMSEATVRRRTEAAGATLVDIQANEAAAARRTLNDVPGAPVQQVSVDGVMAPLVKGEWAEVKLLAIRTVMPGRQRGTVQTTDLSYFGRMAPIAAFCAQASGEIHRRGGATATTVAGVVDGAAWCQHFLDVPCPEAVRILA